MTQKKLIDIGVMSVIVILAIATPAGGTQLERMNVLFIAVDDLRTQLGCYGHNQMVSPNIDRMASEGVLFTRAYCQQAVCSPSRTSLMTGARPDTTKVWDLDTHFRDHIPDVVTVSEHFKNSGYYSHGIGKIYHGGFNDERSWSVPFESQGPTVDGLPRGVGAYFSEKGMRLLSREMEIQRTRAKAYMEEHGLKELDRIQAKEFRSRGLPWEAPDVPDDALPDGRSARRAIEILRDRKNQDAPFFLAVGFRKPHLPFVAPKKYWDLYDPDQIRLADNPFPPKGAPPFAMTSFGELRNYHGMPSSGPLSPDNAREAIHGYYACVSYTDAQIGRLLEELGDLDLRDRTIVILWGDHGWKLGEHGGWCKHTNFENDTHVPLIISVPGMPAGTKSAALVEFVDIYPTLAELCDLPLPGHLEGKSFVPQIENPDAPGKSAVFSQYHRSHQGTRLMGYSMRTHRFRYTEWRGRASGEVHSIELYDHDIDPKENVNQANNPAYAKVLMDLEELMDGGWQSQNR